MTIDNSLKEFLTLASGEEISDKEWNSIRQCIRCLVSGDRIENKHLKHGVANPMKPMDASSLLIRTKKEHNISLLESARKLVMI